MNLPKLNKDQIHKISLSGILFAILIYGYFQFLLGPLAVKDTANIKQLADLENKLAEGKRQVRLGTNALETSATAEATLRQIQDMIPKEAAIAWFPPKVTGFFEKRALPKVSVKLQGTSPLREPGLEEFKYYTWNVTFPPANFNTTIAALHQLENEDPLLAITTLTVQASPDEPENQRVTAIFQTLLK